ncbi:MAG: Holliday junction resolvase RuvX [Pseudohongiellaceae bacterium]
MTVNLTWLLKLSDSIWLRSPLTSVTVKAITLTALTLICFDYGTQKIGVAVGQTITATASPLPVIKCKNGDQYWEAIDEVLKQWKPGALVVGMPYNMDGSENEMTVKARQFMKKLEEKYALQVHSVDERLSTREARNFSRENAEVSGKKFDEKEAVDSIAAQLILESWLEHNT